MSNLELYKIILRISLGEIPPSWSDFNTPLSIQASFLREDELAGSLDGFTKRWNEEDTSIIQGRSAIIPGPEGQATFNASTSSSELIMTLNKIDFDALDNSMFKGPFSTLFVWVSPVGAAAVSLKGDKSKFGLLKLYGKNNTTKKTFTLGEVTTTIMVFEIKLHKSVVSYTIDHIQRYNHGKNEVIEDIKSDNVSTENLHKPWFATHQPTLSENADARFGVLSVPRNASNYVRDNYIPIIPSIEDEFNPSYQDISDGFWKNNKGILDLKPELGEAYGGAKSQNYGDYITIGNNGKIYRRDVFSNLAWGYTGDYIGYGADQMNEWARLDPSPIAPQDEIATIHGTKMNHDVSDPSENQSYRQEMFDHIVNILNTDDRMTALWIKKVEDENTNFIQRMAKLPEFGDEAQVTLEEFDAGEPY